MITMRGTSTEYPTVSPMIIQTQSPSYPMSGLYSTKSAECCPGIISIQWACLPINYLFFRPVKYKLGLRTPSVEERLKEHQWHIRLEQPGKTTVAENSVGLGYHIQFHNTTAHSLDFLPTPRHAHITTLACYLLAHFYDVSPSLSLMVFHKAHSPSPSVFIELFFFDWHSVCGHLLKLVPRSRIFLP
jgi:hypothetical protein